MFYLPRHPENVPPESRVIEGRECDLWALPEAPAPNGAAGAKTRSGLGLNGAAPHVTFTDPTTGEAVDLTSWAGHHADRFEVVAALAARSPGIFGPRVSGVKRHLECPFEQEHTAPGRDGTYAVNASEIGQAGLTRRGVGFYIGCSHNACSHRDRLDLLAGLLERGWLRIDDLTDRRFLIRPPDAHDPAGGATADEDERETAANPADPASWPEPVDLLGQGVEAAPPFPMEFLPGAFGEFVADVADRMQCRPDFVAIPLLISAATLIGKDFRLAPKAADPWPERPCLWGGIISGPATIKSPAAAEALATIRLMQLEMHQAQIEALARYEAELEAAQRAEARWQQECKQARKDGLPEPPKPEDAKAPQRPTMRRVLTSETTQEKLVELMNENPRGLMLYRDELSAWFRTFDQYRQGGDRQFYLECHVGGMYVKDRKLAGTIIVEDLFLNIFGGLQPEVVSRVLAGGDHDGMAARFSLLVWPDVPAGFAYIDRPPREEAAAEVARVLRRLHDLDPSGFHGPFVDLNRRPVLRFDGDAQPVFRDWYTRTMTRLRSGEFDGAMAAHVGKYPGLFARLAIVPHLIRWVVADTASPVRVDAATAHAVERFIDDYLEPHARRIYRHLGQDPAHAGARRIAAWLKATPGVTAFSARDVRRKCWSGLTDQDGVNRALDYLDNVANWVACEDDPPGPKGGRPTTRYRVNPRIREL